MIASDEKLEPSWLTPMTTLRMINATTSSSAVAENRKSANLPLAFSWSMPETTARLVGATEAPMKRAWMPFTRPNFMRGKDSAKGVTAPNTAPSAPQRPARLRGAVPWSRPAAKTRSIIENSERKTISPPM